MTEEATQGDETVDDAVDHLLGVPPGVTQKAFEDHVVSSQHGTKWGTKPGVTGDFDYMAVVRDAPIVVTWSIQAAASGVIGNVIYDRARAAMSRIAGRLRRSAEPPHIEDVEAHDIAVFALALAGVAIYPTLPGRSERREHAASEVIRFDGRVLVRFTVTTDCYRDVQDPSERIRITWHQRDITEVLLPEEGASVGNIKWRAYSRPDIRPFAADDAEAERITQAHWPNIRRELSNEEPGEWHAVPSPEA